MRDRWLQTLQLVSLLVVFGCADGPDRAEPAPVPEWTTELTVSVGVQDGDEAQVFGRVATARKLTDGRIAVADGGNYEVRLFMPDGSHYRSFGGRGEGPGEFDFLSGLARNRADTLIAGSTNRVAQYSSDGTFAREQKLDWTGIANPPFFVETARPLDSGTFLLQLLESSAGAPEEQGLHRGRILYIVAAPDGQVIDTLGVFGALEQLSYREDGRTFSAVPLFPLETEHATSPSHIVIGDSGIDSVLVYDIRRRTRAWIRPRLDRAPLTAPVTKAAAAKACDWAATQQDKARCAAGLRRLPAQEWYPHFQEIAVDSSGFLWVRMFAEDRPNQATWMVFDDRGQNTARVFLPGDFRPTQIGSQYVLGVRRDSMGVQSVQEFAISR